MARHSSATFWFVLPSLPMFLVIPELLKRGLGFWPSLVAACLSFEHRTTHRYGAVRTMHEGKCDSGPSPRKTLDIAS